MSGDIERLQREFGQWNDVRVLCEENGLPVPERVTEALAVIQAALDELKARHPVG